jgi:mRNA interferase MazF
VVTPTVGSVVLVSFPFSDLSEAKLRPTLVLADSGRDDWVLCQITSNAYSDPRAVTPTNAGFSAGSLRATSHARPGKLFTASNSLMASQVGILSQRTLNTTIQAVVDLLLSGYKA